MEAGVVSGTTRDHRWYRCRLIGRVLGVPNGDGRGRDGDSLFHLVNFIVSTMLTLRQ